MKFSHTSGEVMDQVIYRTAILGGWVVYPPGLQHESAQADSLIRELVAEYGHRLVDRDLVLRTGTGRPLDAGNVRREFRRVSVAAGIGSGLTSSELRHAFVSLIQTAMWPWKRSLVWWVTPFWMDDCLLLAGSRV